MKLNHLGIAALVAVSLVGLGQSLDAGQMRRVTPTDDEIAAARTASKSMIEPMKVEWPVDKASYFGFSWEESVSGGPWTVVFSAPTNVPMKTGYMMFYVDSAEALGPGPGRSWILDVRVGGRDGILRIGDKDCPLSQWLGSNVVVPGARADYTDVGSETDPDNVLVVTSRDRRFRLRFVRSDEKPATVVNGRPAGTKT